MISENTLVELGRVIELGDPLFSVYIHPLDNTRFFAVSEGKPYYCVEANSIVEAAEKAQESLNLIARLKREHEENDCA